MEPSLRPPTLPGIPGSPPPLGPFPGAECGQPAQCQSYFMYICTQLAEMRASIDHLGGSQNQMNTALNVVAVWQARQEEKDAARAKELQVMQADVRACASRSEIERVSAKVNDCVEKRVLWAFGLGVMVVASVLGAGGGWLVQSLHLIK